MKPFSPLNDPRLSAAKNDITGLWNTNAGKIECIHRRKILKREANGAWLLTSEKYVERDFASER